VQQYAEDPTTGVHAALLLPMIRNRRKSNENTGEMAVCAIVIY